MKRCSKWNVIVPLCLVLSETVLLSEQSFKCSAQQPQTCSVWSRSSVDGEQVRSLTFSRNVNPSVLHGPCVKGLSDWYWALWEHGPVCVCVCVLCCAGRCVCVQVSSELFFIPFNKVEWYEMMARSDCVEESSASIAGKCYKPKIRPGRMRCTGVLQPCDEVHSFTKPFWLYLWMVSLSKSTRIDLVCTLKYNQITMYTVQKECLIVAMLAGKLIINSFKHEPECCVHFQTKPFKSPKMENQM